MQIETPTVKYQVTASPLTKGLIALTISAIATAYVGKQFLDATKVPKTDLRRP